MKKKITRNQLVYGRSTVQVPFTVFGVAKWQHQMSKLPTDIYKHTHTYSHPFFAMLSDTFITEKLSLDYKQRSSLRDTT